MVASFALRPIGGRAIDYSERHIEDSFDGHKHVLPIRSQEKSFVLALQCGDSKIAKLVYKHKN